MHGSRSVHAEIHSARQRLLSQMGSWRNICIRIERAALAHGKHFSKARPGTEQVATQGDIKIECRSAIVETA